jgi:NAD(P)-dependent dehydrogenase (short-subunit alcohol dehydrogenase family)
LKTIINDHEIDGILNNVGLVRPAPLEEMTLTDLDDVLDLNLRVALQTAQAALPHMKAQRWGRIVQTSSLVTVGVPFRSSGAADGRPSFSQPGSICDRTGYSPICSK